MSKIIALSEMILTPQGKVRYLEIAAQLKPMVVDFDGFIRAERFQSLVQDDKILSMSVWESEEALAKWRNTMEHRMGQMEAREKLFVSYNITVCSSLREYTGTDREEAPKDSTDFLLKSKS